MSSINPHYTFNYSQPEEYRFSHDSVFLARRVFELSEQDQIADVRGLDLCSGCGIIGLDFLFHCRKEWGGTPKSFDFLEVQDVYRKHFETNQELLGELSTQIRFLNQNYDTLTGPEYSGRYDLILCNPPYFFPDKGTLSPSEFKNRCRFFIDSDFTHLLHAVTNALSENGRAYVLLRDLSEHGWNALEQARSVLKDQAHVELLGDIRGTHLALITRLNPV